MIRPSLPPDLIRRLLGLVDGEARRTTGLERLIHVGTLLGYFALAGAVFLAARMLLPLAGEVADVLTPFLLAFILVYVINPVLRWFQEEWKLSRLGVVVITYVLFGSVILLVFSLLLPIAAGQLSELRLKAAMAAEQARARQVRLAEARRASWTAREEADAATTATLRLALDPAGPVSDGMEAASPADDVATAAIADRPTTSTLAPEPAGTPPPRLTREEELRLLAEEQDGEEGVVGRATAAVRRAGEQAQVAVAEWLASISGDVAQLPQSLGSVQRAAATTTSVASVVGGYLGSLLGNVVALAVLLSFVIVIAFYMLIDYSRLVEGFWSAVPVEYHEKTARVLAKIDYSLGGFLRGQLLICVTLACVWTAWLMLAMGLYRYALLVGLTAGLFNFIPYLGPAIGGIATSAYVLLSPEYAGASAKMGGILLALVGLGAVQMLEGFVLQPKFVGERAQLHPLVIILALIAGGQFGFVGLLLAVPAACVARVLWLELVWEPYARRQRAALVAAGGAGGPAAAGEEVAWNAGAMRVFEETQCELEDRVEAERARVTAVLAARALVREKQRLHASGPAGSGEAAVCPSPAARPGSVRPEGPARDVTPLDPGGDAEGAAPPTPQPAPRAGGGAPPAPPARRPARSRRRQGGGGGGA